MRTGRALRLKSKPRTFDSSVARYLVGFGSTYNERGLQYMTLPRIKTTIFHQKYPSFVERHAREGTSLELINGKTSERERMTGEKKYKVC